MTPEEREQLKAEVRRRRQAGESYGKIAAACGINKAQAHRWAGDVTRRNGNQDVRATPRTLLTPRQRRFLKALPTARTQADAAVAAGCSVAAAGKWASQTLRNEQVASEFVRLLERKGLSEDDIADTHRELRQATRVVASHRREDGGWDVLERPDGIVRAKAVELAWRLHGRLEQQPAGGGNVQVQVMLNLGGPTEPTQAVDSIDVAVDDAVDDESGTRD